MKREKETRREWVGWKRLISSEETKKKKRITGEGLLRAFVQSFSFIGTE